MHNPPHPGIVLKELYMDPLNLSIAKTAEALGVSRVAINRLSKGRQGISANMAIRLAEVFGGTAESWLEMQADYKLYESRASIDLSNVKELKPKGGDA
jgi:addiction module HigA family antidote